MLDLDHSSTTPKPKCYYTSTQMSKYLNHAQPPTKKPPFSTISSQNFTHTLDLLLPASSTAPPNLSTSYHKLHAKLSEILKNPPRDSLLISENSEYTLLNQTLTLHLSRENFTRSGLSGHAITPNPQGRKHAKDFFQVRIDLSLPSSQPGKPAYEKLMRACKEVFNESVTWLVWTPEEKTPFAEHFPTKKIVEPTTTPLPGAQVPSFGFEPEDSDSAMEILEWLSLATNLASPRILSDDNVDSYLSRYQTPSPTTTQDLVRLRWHGLLPSSFVQKIFIEALKAADGEWLSLSATSFTGESYTILVHDGTETKIWEYKD